MSSASVIEWRSIKDSIHEVSNTGIIRNKDTKTQFRQHIDCGTYWSNGYYIGKEVLKAFDSTKNCENYIPMYINNNKSDNRLENLYWSINFQKYIFTDEKWKEIYCLKDYFCSNKGKIFNTHNGQLVKVVKNNHHPKLHINVTVNLDRKLFILNDIVFFSFNPHIKKDKTFMFSHNYEKIENFNLDELKYIPRNEHRINENEENKEEKEKNTKEDKEDNNEESKYVEISEEELKNEKWIEIPTNPLYKVSNLGRIMTIKTKYIKKLSLSEQGYVRVLLASEKRNDENIKMDDNYSVHRIMMLSFYPNPNADKLIVNHKNGIKYDNRLSNLEWCTYQDNTRHARENGLMKITGRTIKQIDIYTGIIIAEFDTIVNAAKNTGVPLWKIEKILYEESGDGGGYNWEYKEQQKEIVLEVGEILKDIYLSEKKTKYKISNYGRVISYQTRKPKELKPATSHGYLRTNLYMNGISHDSHIHTLVAKYFVDNPDPENFKIVNHKDENKKNNKYTNLEWTNLRGNIITSIGNK
jgi:hypothetical protein